MRAVNRAGQSLIRQLDSAEDVESELDKLSDDYYDILDKAKDKLKDSKENLKKVKEFVEIIEIIEIWVTEVFEIIGSLRTVGNDPAAIKSKVKEIENIQEDVVKYSVKFKVILRAFFTSCLIL